MGFWKYLTSQICDSPAKMLVNNIAYYSYCFGYRVRSKIMSKVTKCIE